jgi:transcriptional regulator with XRE-family HTH domain
MAVNSDDYSRALARRLMRAKDESQYTVRSLAEASDLAPKTIQAYLSGKTPMRVPDFIRLCGLLGMDPRDVMTEVSNSL